MPPDLLRLARRVGKTPGGLGPRDDVAFAEMQETRGSVPAGDEARGIDGHRDAAGVLEGLARGIGRIRDGYVR